MSAFLLFGLNFCMTSADATLGCMHNDVEDSVHMTMHSSIAEILENYAVQHLDNICIHDNQFVWL